MSLVEHQTIGLAHFRELVGLSNRNLPSSRFGQVLILYRGATLCQHTCDFTIAQHAAYRRYEDWCLWEYYPDL